MNHSSLVGGRTVIEIAPFGQVLTQLAHSVQLVLSSIVRGNSNMGQPATMSVPLKQAAREAQVAQTSVFARSCTIPVRE